MKKSTLCYCIRDSELLLGMKKRGFGADKWNGFGGKVPDTETPKETAVREQFEESELILNEGDLVQVAFIRFSFESKLLFECYVYTTTRWSGDTKETDEMRPQWFKISDLPFETMWVADRLWLPLILSGKTIEAEVNFSEDGSSVKKFSYKEVVFE